MSTSSLRPMRKGGFVALSVITCVLALCDLLSGFFFYSYVQSEGGLGVTLPALEAIVAPLLALAAAVLLLIATLSVQKSPKASPLVAISLWAMALSVLATPIFYYQAIDSLRIAASVLVCAVLITAGILSVNQLRAAAMSFVVLGVGAAYAIYLFVDLFPLTQLLWQRGAVLSVVGNVIFCLLPLLFCVTVSLLELCKDRLATKE